MENPSKKETDIERNERLKKMAAKAAEEITMDPNRPIEQQFVAFTYLRNMEIERKLDEMIKRLEKRDKPTS